MIRALGYSLATPEQLVIYPVGNDIHLHWSDSGAPYFRIYSATTPDGPFSTLEGSTDDTSFVDVGVVPAEEIRFYHVVGSVNP